MIGEEHLKNIIQITSSQEADTAPNYIAKQKIFRKARTLKIKRPREEQRLSLLQIQSGNALEGILNIIK